MGVAQVKEQNISGLRIKATRLLEHYTYVAQMSGRWATIRIRGLQLFSIILSRHIVGNTALSSSLKRARSLAYLNRGPPQFVGFLHDWYVPFAINSDAKINPSIVVSLDHEVDSLPCANT